MIVSRDGNRKCGANLVQLGFVIRFSGGGRQLFKVVLHPVSPSAEFRLSLFAAMWSRLALQAHDWDQEVPLLYNISFPHSLSSLMRW
jgi:hypothetical protein